MPPPLREACPQYDAELLHDVLLLHARTEGAKAAFAFGVYDAVQLPHAVRGSALLRCAGLLKALLSASPAGHVRYSDLKMSLKHVGMQLPEVHLQGRWRHASVDDWAGATAERCMVLLAHLRRLHQSSQRLAQCSAKLTEPEGWELADLLSRLEPDRSPLQRGTTMGSMAESVVSDGGRQVRLSPRSGLQEHKTNDPNPIFYAMSTIDSINNFYIDADLQNIKIIIFDAGLGALIKDFSVLV
jgi:hypothetical protein